MHLCMHAVTEYVFIMAHEMSLSVCLPRRGSTAYHHTLEFGVSIFHTDVMSLKKAALLALGEL